jgi:hypothetical protein
MHVEVRIIHRIILVSARRDLAERPRVEQDFQEPVIFTKLVKVVVRVTQSMRPFTMATEIMLCLSF